MKFIKILFNIAFTVLITRCEAEIEVGGIAISEETTTPTSTVSASYKNNTAAALRKQEQIIDNSIDFQADPCEDFYQHACGEWKQQLHHNDNGNDGGDGDIGDVGGGSDANADDEGGGGDKNVYKYDRTLGMIDYLADKEVQQYFNVKNLTAKKKISAPSTIPTSTKEPDFVIKSYKYYKSCIAIEQYEPIKYLEWLEVNEHIKWPSLMNTAGSTATATDDHDAAVTAGAEAKQKKAKESENEKQLDEEVEEYKMEEDWQEVVQEMQEQREKFQRDNFNWINTLAILRKYGLNGIFIEEIIYSQKFHPSQLIVGLDKPIKDGGFKSLKSENLKTIISHLNVTLTKEEFKTLWLEITKFEWKLIKLNDMADEVGPKLLSVQQFPVPWLKTYLSVVLNDTEDINENMKFVITNSAYLIGLDDLLKDYDDHFLQKYLKLRFLWHLYKQEPYKFANIDCIAHVKQFLPLAFEWIFEQSRPDLKEEIPNIQEMYLNIRKQFNATLYRNRNNFDKTILEYFVTKLEDVKLKVGRFSRTTEKSFFYNNRKFYNKLKFSSQDFYGNHLKILNFNFKAIHSLSLESSSTIYFDMKEFENGLSSAPYFNSRLNTIQIPLSLLQQPIYHAELSDVYKYSTLGFQLAQTLMYGFNLNGLALNEQGKLRHNYKCLGELNSYELDDEISTVSGLRLAYHTFFHSNANNLIPNRKLFFFNFAQSYCASPSADDDLGRSHVNQALAQFSEFSKIFECSTDSHMNPHDKCYLWD